MQTRNSAALRDAIQRTIMVAVVVCRPTAAVTTVKPALENGRLILRSQQRDTVWIFVINFS